MAISGIAGSGIDLASLARSNTLQYTGAGSLSGLAGTNSQADAFGTDGIGADSLGLSAAELGLARQSGASAASAAQVGRVSSTGASNFEDALLKAIDGVNTDQNKTSNLIQQMVVAPDSVNAHDVTIAMAESNLSLNLARTILDRIVRGWKDVINTR